MIPRKTIVITSRAVNDNVDVDSSEARAIAGIVGKQKRAFLTLS